MQDITPLFEAFRTALVQLWHVHFTLPKEANFPFRYETERAWAKMEDALFEAIVLARAFDAAPATDQEGAYHGIRVVPNSAGSVLIAERTGSNYQWSNHDLVSSSLEEEAFLFMGLFDWFPEEKMEAEFVRARMVRSESMPESIGSEILFRFEDVRFFSI